LKNGKSKSSVSSIVSMNERQLARWLEGSLSNMRRRQEIIEVTRNRPDLLLKIAEVGLGNKKVNCKFCDFASELPNECLLKSFGGVDLEDKYRGLWKSVKDKFAKNATPVAFEALVRMTPMSEGASEIITGYLGIQRCYWADVVRSADMGDERSRETIVRTIFSQFLFGKVPKPALAVSAGESFGDYVLRDPRRQVVFRVVPWVVGDVETGCVIERRVMRAISCLGINKLFSEFLSKMRERKEEVLKGLRDGWGVLKEVARRWVPGFGLTKITPDFWGLDPKDVGVIEVVVDPTGREFPALGVTLKGVVCFHAFTDQFEVGTDGIPDLSEWENEWERIFRLAVWSVVAARLWEYATAPETKAADYVAKPRPSEKNGKKRPVPPCFVRLPAGYKASKAAIQRAIECFGYAPPPGKTFRMSPPIHERQTPEDYEAMVLVAKAPSL